MAPYDLFVIETINPSSAQMWHTIAIIVPNLGSLVWEEQYMLTCATSSFLYALTREIWNIFVQRKF